MNTVPQSDPGDRPPSRLPVIAGLIAAFATSGWVSWATPDGNLVVTLVPGLAVGLVVYGVASWRQRRSKAQ